MSCVKCKGVLNVFVSGRTIQLDGESDLTVWPTDTIRDPRAGGEFVTSEISPYIEGTFRVPRDMKVQDIISLCGVPVTAELCDGRTFHAQSAAQVAQEAYNAKENTILLRFIDETIEEIA